MKRLLCCALLVAMAFCAVAEEALTPGAEAVPVQAAPVDPFIPREALDLALPAEASEAAGPETEPDGAAANRTWEVSDWGDFISKANSAGNGDTIVIESDISQGGKNPVRIDGKTVTLDLQAGLTGSKASTAIGIAGSGGMAITGWNWNTIESCGTAVFVFNGCALTLRDVTIANCYNTGVENKGTFTMKSGGITDCGSFTGNGYGVYNWGSFTMTGGDITGNKTSVLNYGSFAMRGGWITGNGRGVCTEMSDTVLTVSGNVHIKENTEYDVLLQKGQAVAVDGALHANAEIGITLSDDNLPGPGAPVVVTRGLRGNGTADNFIVWGDYEKRINADGELEVALKVPGDPTLPAAPDYTLLAKLSASGNTAMKLKWTDVDGAEGYDVYFGKRGGRLKNVATVTGATSHKLSGLDRAEVYGAYVTAWVTEGGKKTAVGEPSPTVYAVAGGYDRKWCNPKSVSVKQSSLTLKAGKTAKIRASVAGVKAGRKVLREEKPLRYYSSNANVATVSGDGKVTAIAAGKCTIWAVANNGVRTGVKVRVK